MQNWKLIKGRLDEVGDRGGNEDSWGDGASIDDIWIPDQPAGISGRPKLRFLFTASFIFRNGALQRQIEGAEGNLVGNDDMARMAFQLKQATRPNISVNYVDTNFYGYRTKIATKTDYGVVNLSFYDDPSDKAHSILTSYLRTISPISRVSNANLLGSSPFRTNTIGALQNSAALGPLEMIRVNHFYLGPDNDKRIVYKKDVYEYLNPKLQNFTYDELDMSVSDVNTITMSFNFDTVYITEGAPAEADFGY